MTTTVTTNSPYVRPLHPLHRLRPDEPGAASRGADAAAPHRRAV
ncbi:hypothetical protein ACFWQ6_12285 [Streptomyces coelicoflavus]|nr:hypothetical protein [Streptomyces sp. KO7888]